MENPQEYFDINLNFTQLELNNAYSKKINLIINLNKLHNSEKQILINFANEMYRKAHIELMMRYSSKKYEKYFSSRKEYKSKLLPDGSTQVTEREALLPLRSPTISLVDRHLCLSLFCTA